MRSRRVTIVTSGHPSSCPRMVKAADAAVEAGFSVRMVSVDYVDWAAALDDALVARRGWEWQRVQVRRAAHPVVSRWVSARHRAARVAVSAVTPRRSPSRLMTYAYARTHPELVAAILAEPFDFLYGGTVGALAATAEAARRARKPFALDLEDFHLDESEDRDASLSRDLAARVVCAALQGARFVTTASPPMAEAYTRHCGVTPLVIHNVVPLPAVAPNLEVPAGPLQLYWFSQTIGPGRGLEEVVAAVAIAGIDATLHLRGARGSDFVDLLDRQAQTSGARLSIVLHQPAHPDAMVETCREHTVGLSTEQPAVMNHDVCVSNKMLTYLAAGMAIVATATKGHRYMVDQAPEAITAYTAGDPRALAGVLRHWDRDRASVAHARRASWQAAASRFHWEHPLERGALMDAYERALA